MGRRTTQHEERQLRVANSQRASIMASEAPGPKPALMPAPEPLIVLLSTNLTYWPRSEAACGANAAARRLGYRVVCLDWHGYPPWEKEYLSQVLQRQPAGVVLFCPLETRNLPLCQQVATELPTVQAMMPHPDIPSDLVAVDDYAGATMAVEHLIELGHRHIGHITYRIDLPPVHDRLRAYLDALARAGLSRGDEAVLRLPGYWFWDHRNMHRRRTLLRQFLQEPRRPRAVFACTDRLAAELVAVAWELGLAVPHDLAVVGFDDLPTHSLSGVPLTTVRQDFRRLGGLAMERVVARVRGEASGPPTRIPWTPELIIRESSTERFATGKPWGRVRQYLQKNFRRPVTAREVAQVAPFEVHYFSKRFPRVFGKRYTSYLRDLRLECAVDLLLNTELKIHDIARQAGFPSPNHFFRVFKEVYGTTPVQYRTHNTFRA